MYKLIVYFQGDERVQSLALIHDFDKKKGALRAMDIFHKLGAKAYVINSEGTIIGGDDESGD